MARRKPAPSYPYDESAPLQNHTDDDDESEVLLSQSQERSAGSRTLQYALMDTSAPPQPRMPDFNTISQAVDQLQNRFSSSSYDTQFATNMRGRVNGGYNGAPKLQRSSSRKASSSGSTAVYYKQPSTKVQDEKGLVNVESHRPHAYLPTIDSGEPLRWGDLHITRGEDDPFTDSAALKQPLVPSHITGPSRPQSQLSAYDEFLRGTLPSRTSPKPPISSPNKSLSNDSPSRLYRRADASPKQGSPQYIDHFRHDAEAYASGTNSRDSYYPPRSRSPTPAVERDDQSDGDDSMDHTSAPHELDDDQFADLEKHGMMARPPDIIVNRAVPLPDGKQTSISDFPETPVETRHFGPAPSGRVLRRHKTKKRVQLTNGNLVVELPVPPKLVLPRKGDTEVMEARYTAVTCDPDEFEGSGFFLRQNESGRRTELFICITMYNEDEVLFCRTMYGVMRNISHLCSRKNSQTWGVNAWKKVVVCIVSDGRKKIHPRVLDCLTLLGVYQPGGHMKNMVNNKAVTAHLFEYTTSFALDPNLHFQYPDKGIVPTQIIFCMKEKNQKKINSHRWFFNAFSSMLQPNVCVLLDVGTRPSNKSIYHLWKTFDLNSNVAGACGEIAAYKGKNWIALLNPLVAAQNFEYKISNILDKPTESLFGYISVLPGAFSAYRYIALQNDKNGLGPLASYFKGEVLHGRDTDIFTSNMYLAEDRILCFELVAKANSSWVLRYVKSAVGETDVPDDLPEFISQRRRWLNGSFFAATYAIAHVGQMMRSGHSFGRKVALLAQVAYNILNLVSSWFAIGNFYLFFVILTSSLESPEFKMKGIRYFNSIIQYTLASIVIACFLFSMGNKPRAAHWKYKLIAISLAILMVYLIFAAVKCSIMAASQGGGAYQIMLFSIIVTYGVYTFSSLFAFDPWHLLTSFLPYMLLSPSYINILNIYAFSNLDDISWGTKEDNTPDSDLGAVIQDSHSQVDVEMLAEAADANDMYEEALSNLKHRTPVSRSKAGPSNAEKEQAAKDYYAGVRTNVLLAWVLSNGLLLAGILGGGQSTETFKPGGGLTAAKAYMTFVLAFVGITSIIRFTGSTLYLVARVFTG